MGLFGFFNNKKKETLDKGLEKTKESVFSKLARAVAGKSTVDDDVLDDLEEVLITSDVGVETTVKSSAASKRELLVISTFLPLNLTESSARKSLICSLKIILMIMTIGICLPITNLMSFSLSV